MFSPTSLGKRRRNTAIVSGIFFIYTFHNNIISRNVLSPPPPPVFRRQSVQDVRGFWQDNPQTTSDTNSIANGLPYVKKVWDLLLIMASMTFRDEPPIKFPAKLRVHFSSSISLSLRRHYGIESSWMNQWIEVLHIQITQYILISYLYYIVYSLYIL